MKKKNRVRPDKWGCYSERIGGAGRVFAGKVSTVSVSKVRKSRDRFIELLGLFDAGEQLEKKYMNRDFLVGAIDHYNRLLKKYDGPDRKNS